MKNTTLTGEFAKLCAELANKRWACSAISQDGSLVLSGWNHLLKRFVGGRFQYEGCLSRWKGNPLGRKLLYQHINRAVSDNLPVRLVLVTAENPDAIIAGEYASALPKSFSAKFNLVGKVIAFDGDTLKIVFEEA